ncbi:hypothetical protein [Prevotella sp. HUN102]|uniref:hypothetical protein n=1 Tax=Prevotella sp. HUN102 TaxID=1392486 RepID=UPI0012DD632A|nr:hypothetical protein [Prevotella sp. HUN102]
MAAPFSNFRVGIQNQLLQYFLSVFQADCPSEKEIQQVVRMMKGDGLMRKDGKIAAKQDGNKQKTAYAQF